MPFLSELVGQVYDELARRMTSTQPAGLPTGIPAIDEMIGGGWVRQQLSYLVGDSSVGKSWLASSWMMRGAQWLLAHTGERPMSGYILTGAAADDATRKAVLDKENKQPIIVFWSLEMAESPVTTRMMAQLGKETYKIVLDSGHLQRGNLGVQPGTPEWDKVLEYMKGIYWLMHDEYGKYIYIDFESRNIPQFRSILSDLAAAYDICFVVVDYFRLIEDVASDGSMSTLQAEKSQKLKDIAKQFDCHVLSIFDITREGQKSTGIDVSQMKGGTAAQYDADLVLTLEQDREEAKAAQRGPPLSHKHLILRAGKGRHVANGRLDLRMEMATGYVELYDQRDAGVWDTQRGE